jgi:ketosteroid isomerase-like protein
MKNTLLVFSLLLLTGFQLKAQDKDVLEVKRLMAQQESDWNRGDIDAFMQVYWKSEKLQFISAKGITYGWQQTIDNYKKANPDQTSMGKLIFEIKSVEKLSKKVIMLSGSWELDKEGPNPGGHYLLIWKKIKGEWRIVADHTSVKKT